MWTVRMIAASLLCMFLELLLPVPQDSHMLGLGVRPPPDSLLLVS